MHKLVVLMYHAIESRDEPSNVDAPGDRVYVLNEKDFRAQLEYLYNNGYRSVLYKDLSRAESWPKNGVIITFDDGHRSNYTVALPILEEFGFKAEFFVTTDWIGDLNYMTEEQIRGLAKAGMVVGSHGVSHAYLSDLRDEEIQNELSVSKGRLERILGEPVWELAAPGGRIDGRVVKIATEVGYLTLFSSKMGVFRKGNSPMSISRVAVKRGMDIAEFRQIIRHERRYYLFAKMLTSVRNFAKVLLGNKTYELLRSGLLGQR